MRKGLLCVPGTEFEARERALLGDRFDELYASPPQVFRGVTVNALRMQPQAFGASAPFSVTPSPFCASSYLIGEDVRAGLDAYHHAGVYYVQEPSAAAPAALAGVVPGMRVLDMCAAPGGKSSQLAAALGGEGILFSNEYEPRRAQVLKSNLERMGVTNAVVTCGDTAKLAAALPEYFDVVLVDAPCSGEGMFRKEPQALERHSQALVEQCAALGAQILDNAAACCAPGGRIVFSTCTFAPEEDEGQVGAFLARHPEFELVPVAVSFGSPGESARCGAHPFDASVTRRIYPCHGGEGHFMALLQKSDGGSRLEPRGCKPAKPPRELTAFLKQCFPHLTDAPVIEAGGGYNILPQYPVPNLSGLSVVRAGVPAGSVVKGRFEPDHALFMAYGAQCSNSERLTHDDIRTAAWLRGEPIAAQTAGDGFAAVLVDGFPLGFGKCSQGVVKNRYPKGLRNLK